MKATLPVILIAGLTVSGCCMRNDPDDFSRLIGSERETYGLCGIFSGWGTLDEPERFEAAYTPVSPADYAERLCRGVEMEDYATCINRTVDYYREAARGPLPPDGSISGPFAVVVNGQVYLGRYSSGPFHADFRVDSGTKWCRGSYNAFTGSTQGVFDVICHDGRRGTADIVLDREGRNGIGQIVLDDGSRGDILFGHAAVAPKAAG